MNPPPPELVSEPPAGDARGSLNAHAAETGRVIAAKYGPRIGWPELLRLLEDRTCVRYPCQIVFDASALQPGELAHPVPRGDSPQEGFTMHVHPRLRTQLEAVPALVLYQLVLVNYGEFASAADAEALGAHALGLSEDAYYHRICELVDSCAGSPEPAAHPC